MGGSRETGSSRLSVLTRCAGWILYLYLHDIWGSSRAVPISPWAAVGLGTISAIPLSIMWEMGEKDLCFVKGVGVCLSLSKPDWAETEMNGRLSCLARKTNAAPQKKSTSGLWILALFRSLALSFNLQSSQSLEFLRSHFVSV